MSRSVWNISAEQLLQRASYTDPTPGGGAIAAVAAAFGMSLVQMAIEVTISAPESATGSVALLEGAQSQARQLQAGFVEAADRDVVEFEALIAGYRMLRADGDGAGRRRAIDAATVTATRGPLSIAEASVIGIALVDGIEPLMKATIVSDAQAGRDLMCGAALAALRTADINLVALEGRKHVDAPVLRERRDAVYRAVTRSEGHA